MAAVVDSAAAYFASLNPLAKKILQEHAVVVSRKGEEWNSLSSEQQDDVIDDYFIDPEVRRKYEASGPKTAADLPQCFPKLVIESGEKIVVDFEKDCWTWRDEHSAPFSWKTRSQQDLSLWPEEEDEGLGDEDRNSSAAAAKPKRPPRTNKSKSRSPERDVSLAFKPERSIWESPFLAADRGLDAGYHSSQTSDQSKCSMEDTDDLLNRLNMTLAMSMADASHLDDDEELKLLDSSFEVESGVGSCSVQGGAGGVEDASLQGFDSSTLPSTSSGSPSEVRARSSHGSSRMSGDSKVKQFKKLEAEQSLMCDLSLSVASSLDERGGGHVSPVFIGDPGETSTDADSELAPPGGQEMHRGQDEDMAVAGFSLDDWTPSFSPQDNATDDAKTSDDGGVSKTGFDFLDNW